MRVRRIISLLFLAVVSFPVLAQNGGDGIVVDYNNPKKY